MSSHRRRRIGLLGVLGLLMALLPAGLMSPAASADTQLQTFWTDSTAPVVAAAYDHGLVAKATPDVVGDVAKFNQTEVGGLTKVGDRIWFGTKPNSVCNQVNDLLGPFSSFMAGVDALPAVQVDGALQCDFGTADGVAPKIFSYDYGAAPADRLMDWSAFAGTGAMTTDAKNLLANTKSITAVAQTTLRQSSSVSTQLPVVVMAGAARVPADPTKSTNPGSNVFVFYKHPTTGWQFSAAKNFATMGGLPPLPIDGITGFVTYSGGFFAVTSIVAGGLPLAGNLFRWAPMLGTAPNAAAPFPSGAFTYAAALLPIGGATPVSVTVSGSDLYASVTSFAGLAGLFPDEVGAALDGLGDLAGLASLIVPTGKGGAQVWRLRNPGLGGSWTKVWDAGDYEPNALNAALSSGGPISTFDGHVVWSMNQTPLLPAAAHLLLNLGLDITSLDLSSTDALSALDPALIGAAGEAVWGTHRATTLFKSGFAETPAAVDLLYGEAQLPVYQPAAAGETGYGSWVLTDNAMGGVPGQYGRSGFGNLLNVATTSMAVHNNELLVGTQDWSGLAPTVLDGVLAASYPWWSLVADQIDAYGVLARFGFGGDLFRIPTEASGLSPVAEDVRGLGNEGNWGISALFSAGDSLFAGTANPLNLHRDGGWELYRLYTNTPPAAADLVAPADDAALANLQPAFTWTGDADYVDADGDVLTYSVQVAPKVLGECVWAVPSAQQSGQIAAFTPGTPLAEGTYCWRVRTRDGAATVDSAVRTVTLDVTAPAVGITFPAADGQYNPTTWRAGCLTALAEDVCGTALDLLGSGVDAVALQLSRDDGQFWDGSAWVTPGGTPPWFAAGGGSLWSYAFAGDVVLRDHQYALTAKATDRAGNTSSTTHAFSISRFVTSVLYDGEQFAAQNTPFPVRATVTGGSGVCGIGRTVSFSATSVADGSVPVALGSATTNSSGVASRTTTAGLPPDVYEITAGVAANGDCTAASDVATLVVASPGDSADGSGWYSLSGYGRIHFAFNVKRMPDRTYHGQLVVRTMKDLTADTTKAWRLRADITGYVVNSSGVGSISGRGLLQKWNGSGWATVLTNVPFAASFSDGAKVKSKTSDTFGVTLSTASPGAVGFPASAPQTLKKGDIKIAG